MDPTVFLIIIGGAMVLTSIVIYSSLVSPKKGPQYRLQTEREVRRICAAWLSVPRKKRELALMRARQQYMTADDGWIDEPELMGEDRLRAMWDVLRGLTDQQYWVYVEEGRVVDELYGIRDEPTFQAQDDSTL